MVQRHLAADEPHLLGQVGPRPGGIELQLVAHRPAQQLVHRLLAQPAQQIPQRQIDAGDGVDHQTLATVILSRKIHLVPDLLDLAGIAPFQEPRQMLFHDEAGGLAAGCDRETHRAVIGFDFHHQRTQHVDAEALAALAVFGITRHGGGDMVVDPMTAALVVIVGAAAAHHKGAHLFDLRKCHAPRPCFRLFYLALRIAYRHKNRVGRCF